MNNDKLWKDRIRLERICAEEGLVARLSLDDDYSLEEIVEDAREYS